MEYMLKINSQACSACGACLVYSNLVEESADGKAQTKSIRALLPEEVTTAQEMADICLDQAIEVIPMQVSHKVDVLSLIEKANTALAAIAINHVEPNQFKPNVDDYHISFVIDFSGRREHKSYDRAIRECRDLFNRYAYSQRDKAIMGALQEYKVRHMKPYYLFTEDSFYGKINRQVSQILNQLQQDLLAASGGAITLPSNFSEVEVYPDRWTDKYWLEAVVKFESESSAARKVEAEFRDSNYTSLSYYEDCMDAWDWDDHNDKTWYQAEYPSEALDELAQDIKDAIGFADIHEIAAQGINHLIDGYRKGLEKLITDRLALVQSVI